MIKHLLIAFLLLPSTAFSAKPIKLSDKFVFDTKTHEWKSGSVYYVGVDKIHAEKTRHSSENHKEAKENGHFGTNASGSIQFKTIKQHRDNLIIDAIGHNPSKTHYQCLYISTSDNTVHLDDELANEFKGGSFEFLGSDNKFALNQRIKIRITLPKPSDEVDIVNLHLGFHFVPIASNHSCKPPLVDWKLNFHMLDWNIAPLRNI